MALCPERAEPGVAWPHGGRLLQGTAREGATHESASHIPDHTARHIYRH
jgi:hypothetical protein